MSNKSKSDSKKWLISRLKTSGSKKKWDWSPDYADSRHAKGKQDYDNLPKYEGMGSNSHFYNSKINYGLLVRFLRTKVGQDWATVHAEIMERIPSNLMEYKGCVEWFVADLVETSELGLWDKREQKFVYDRKEPLDQANVMDFCYKEFFVDPDSGTLCKVKDAPSSSITRGMSTDELRAYRECQQQHALEQKRAKVTARQEAAETSKQLFKAHNAEKKNTQGD